MQTVNDNIVRITEDNKLMMQTIKDTNAIFYSELKEWQAPDAFRNFSVKYVISGLINYRVGSTIHSVRSNQVLIGNKKPGVISYFESGSIVKSLCLNINMGLIAQAYALLSAKGHADPEHFISNDPDNPSIAERIYSIGAEDFLSPLIRISKILEFDKQSNISLSQEFFLNISEQIVIRLFESCRTYEELKFIHTSTKKEVLRRLDIARNFLQENYFQRTTVKDLSLICNMSEFHFFRAFKQAFNMTPYQCQLKLRLGKARELITNSSLSLTEISERCAFPDLFTFSKAFKRMYNLPPSTLREKKQKIIAL